MLKQDEMVVFKHFSAMETATLGELFSKASEGDATAEFRLGLYSYNMTPGIEDEKLRKEAVSQSLAIMFDDSQMGNIEARTVAVSLARHGVPEATDFIERMNEFGKPVF